MRLEQEPGATRRARRHHMLTRPSPDLRSERGVMLVLFSVVLTLLLFLGSVVVSIGSWYTHVQAPADEGRLRCVRRRRVMGIPLCG